MTSWPRAALGALALALASCSTSPGPTLPSARQTSSHPPQLAFHSDPDGRDDTYLVNADGSDLRALTDGRETVAFPTWSPDGSRLLVLCCSGRSAGLFVMNADGSGLRQLAEAPVGEPAWSPDGSRVAYVSYDDTSIWTMSVDGGAATRLGAGGGPQWSPDGRSIAFFTSRDWPGLDQHNEIYLMTDAGADVRRLTNDATEDVSVTWSPDGTWLAFVSSRSGVPRIMVTRADGGDLHQVSPDVLAGIDDAPAWSPDGSRILFVSYRDGADPYTLGQGNAELLTVRPDGSELRNLTDSPAWDGYPAWSPDGSQIAYSTNDGTDFDLFVMRADGSDRRQLPQPESASGTANDCCPAWRP